MSDIQQAQLKQGVGLLGVVTLGAGVAIGVSIFTVLQPAAQVAGSGLLVALVLSVVPMVLFALAYAYLASVAPVSGASYEWPRRYLHPLVGFAIAWTRILANVGVQVILAQVFAQYLNMILAAPVKFTMACLITLVFGLNYIGIALAARVQIILMLALLVVLATFVIGGAPYVSLERIGSPLGSGAASIGACVVLMITLFLGIESAVEIGEEVKNGRRVIPLGITLAVLLTAVVYAAVAITALGLIGPQRLAGSSVPLLDAARTPFGGWAVPIIVTAALVSIMKSMISNALVFTRSLFAMARKDALPAALARIHPRFGTPHVAILTGWAGAMGGLFLPSNLVFLLLAVNVPTMFKYFACSLSAVKAARQEAATSEEKQILSPTTVTWVGYLGAATAIAIILAGLEADWRPHLLVLGWLVVGLVYWTVQHRKGAAISEGKI